MSAPRVTVVVPCYDQAHFLPEAVASVVAQTFTDWELVVVDDGSPDDTQEVARRLAAAHPGLPIRLVVRENGGLPAARNTGIAAGTGEYVLPLDADDLIAPTFLAHTVRALDEHPDASIAYGAQQNFGEDDAFHPHPPYDFAQLATVNTIGVASLFRRRAWEDVGGYDERLYTYEDWDFWVGCGERGHFGVHVPAAVFHYRVRAGGLASQGAARDRELKAQVLLNHPVLYTDTQIAWAEGVLAGEPGALALETQLYHMPRFVEPAPAPLWGVRGFVTLAFADELLAAPELLRAYGRVFAAGDDATLVVHAPGWSDEEVHAGLAPLVEAEGVDADLLAVTLEPGLDTDRRLRATGHAVLSHRAPALGLLHFDENGVERLRALAGRRLAA